MEGTSIAGDTFYLFCGVSIPDGAHLTSVKWLGTNEQELESGGGILVGTEQVVHSSSKHITYTLQFESVFTSHGGSYTCVVNVSSPFGTIVKANFLPYEVIVQCEFVS